MKRNFVLFVIALCIGVPGIILAADPGLSLLTDSHRGSMGETYSLSTQVLLFMGVLIVLPAGLMMMTSFVRKIIVLTTFRQTQDEAEPGPGIVARLKEAFVQQFNGKRPKNGSRGKTE